MRVTPGVREHPGDRGARSWCLPAQSAMEARRRGLVDGMLALLIREWSSNWQLALLAWGRNGSVPDIPGHQRMVATLWKGWNRDGVPANGLTARPPEAGDF